MKAKLTKQDAEEAKNLYYSGLTLQEVANKYGVSKQCIQQRIAYKRTKRETLTMKLRKENESLKQENGELREMLRKFDIKQCLEVN